MKLSCSFFHQGTPLILAYSWAMPAILAAGKGKGWILLFLLFLHFISLFLPCPLSFISSTISSISFLPFSRRQHKMTSKGWYFVKPQHSQPTIKTWIWIVEACMSTFILSKYSIQFVNAYLIYPIWTPLLFTILVQKLARIHSSSCWYV